MELKGKTVLVTGGGRRIGAAIVQAFAEAGANVIIHCNESIDEAEALARVIPNGRVIKCNLEDIPEVEQLFSKIGRVDVLINNASVYEPRMLALDDAFSIQRHFKINLVAPLTLMREFARQGHPGAIVNIIDQEVGHVTPSGGSYALSRRALRDATLEAARELAPQIRVNAVAPGPVLPPKGMENSRMEKTLTHVPLNRAVALDDLTKSVVFLVQNDSITGTILYVDGGQHLGD